MTYEIRQEPEQLAFGIPSDWNTRPRLTLWMAFLVGFVATMVVVGGCFMMAEGLILNGLLVIVLGLIGASPLVWRRLPHHDVLLRRPDAQEADRHRFRSASLARRRRSRVLPSQPEATRRGRHGGLRAARSTHHRRG